MGANEGLAPQAAALPTPIQAVIPDASVNPSPTASQATETQTTTVEQPKASPTLTEILEQRRNMTNPFAEKQEPVEVKAEETKPAEVTTPAVDSEAEKKAILEKAQQEQFWDLAKNDPNKLIELLKVNQQAPEAKTDEEQPFSAAEWARSIHEQAAEAYHSRPQITLSGILGDAFDAETMDEKDLTETLTDFVRKAVTPQIAAVLEMQGQLKEALELSQRHLQPVIASQAEKDLAQQVFPEIQKIYPAIVGNQEALQHYHKTFDEVVPQLYSSDQDREVLNNPNKYPNEYAKIMKTIAAIAARDFVSQSPAQDPQTTTPQQVVQAQVQSPAPAPVQPKYRDHLGQFAEQKPRSLAEMSEISARKFLSA